MSDQVEDVEVLLRGIPKKHIHWDLEADTLRIDPEAYLREVLTRLADHPVHRIHELLPWKVTLGSEAVAQTDRNTA